MSYELAILPEAEKEWQQLDGSIKLTRPQYRLVYHVDDECKRLTIIAVGSRQAIYEIWLKRVRD